MDVKTVTAAIAISMCMYNYPIKVSTIKNEKHGQTNTQTWKTWANQHTNTVTRVRADLSQNIGVKHPCRHNWQMAQLARTQGPQQYKKCNTQPSNTLAHPTGVNNSPDWDPPATYGTGCRGFSGKNWLWRVRSSSRIKARTPSRDGTKSPDDGGVGSSRGADGTTGGRPRRPLRTAEADAMEPEENGTVLVDTGAVLTGTVPVEDGTAIGAVSEAIVAARVWARRERLGGIRSNDDLKKTNAKWKKNRTQGTASRGKEREGRESKAATTWPRAVHELAGCTAHAQRQTTPPTLLTPFNPTVLQTAIYLFSN